MSRKIVLSAELGLRSDCSDTTSALYTCIVNREVNRK